MSALFLLDADICIYLLKGTIPYLNQRVQSHSPHTLGVSAIVAAELRFGMLNSARPEHNAANLERFLSPMAIYPFTAEASHVYATLKLALRRRGQPIGQMDMLIAAVALANDATLVTNNVREFSRVPGLLVENWAL